MPNFKSISFKMAVLQGAGRICQKTPYGIGLTLNRPGFLQIGMAGGGGEESVPSVISVWMVQLI